MKYNSGMENVHVTVDEIGIESTYLRKTDAEILDCAKQYKRGELWGTWELAEMDELHLAPLYVIGLRHLSDIQRKILERNGIVHYYGLLHLDAFEYASDGRPLLHQFRMFDQIDFDRFQIAVGDRFVVANES